MKRFATMTAVALLAATPAATAFAQDSAKAELNQEVYAMGMAELRGDNYDVDSVRQDNQGSLTFMAHNSSNGRIMVMDDEGNIMSDTMTDLNASANLMGEGEDGEGSLNAMADTSTELGVETMTDDEDDYGSISAGVGTDTSIGVDAEGDSADSGDSSSASVDAGVDAGVGISAEGDDGGDSASIGVDTGIDLGISLDSES